MNLLIELLIDIFHEPFFLNFFSCYFVIKLFKSTFYCVTLLTFFLLNSCVYNFFLNFFFYHLKKIELENNRPFGQFSLAPAES